MWTDIWAGLTGAPWLDQLNLVLGITGVTLMIRRNLWAFPLGLVAVTVQGVLFWQMKFYADSLLQGFFFVLLAYGWWHWRHPQAGATELPVTRLAGKWRLITLLAAAGTWLTWGALSAAVTDAPMPYRDAFIAAFSVAGQWLQSRKKVENWSVWLGVNLVAVWSYAAAGMAYTAFLYLVYFGLALVGWRAWRRAEATAATTPTAASPAASRP